jgi:outer membrane protein TolC
MSPQPAAQAEPTPIHEASHRRSPSERRVLSNPIRIFVGAITAVALTGCALTPRGTDAERARLDSQAARYEPPIEQRNLPELPPEPIWQDVLHRAFLANGELEAAYFEWKAAFERIEVASAYPNSNVALGYSYTFSSENMKTFDRMTFSGGFDSMENLSFPTKVIQQGKVALDEARAAGERFRAAKFALQERVLATWADYVLLAERQRIQRENLGLLQRVLDTATARVKAGGMQEDILRAQIELQAAEDILRNTEADLDMARAMLNGLLARDPQLPLAPPVQLVDPRPVPADANLIAAASELNPELAALARQVEGRADALVLARSQWIPDINPTVVFTGGIAQAVGAVIVLPTTVAEIRGGINEARSILRASEAMLRQLSHERGAAFVAGLISLRNAERQEALFRQRILPVAERVIENLRSSYASGRTMYLDLIEAQRTLLDVRLAIAEAGTIREKRLAELERLAGVDVETLLAPTTPNTITTSGTAQTTTAIAPATEITHHD